MKYKAKKPRSDKKKNVGKVAEVLIKDPNKTIKEIKKETGLGVGTIHRAKKEVEKTGTKDETIHYIVGASKQRLKRIQGVLDRFIEESEKKEELSRGDTSLIKEIAKDDMARITVLGGDATDEQGGFAIESIKGMSLQDIQKAIEVMNGS